MHAEKKETGEGRAQTIPRPGCIPPVKEERVSSSTLCHCVAICALYLLALPQSSLYTPRGKGCAKAAGLHVESGQEIPKELYRIQELPEKLEKARNGRNEPKAKGRKEKKNASNSIRMKTFPHLPSGHEADGTYKQYYRGP